MRFRSRSTRAATVALAAAAMCCTTSIASSAAAKTRTTPHQTFAGKTLVVLDGAPVGVDAKQTQDYYNNLSALFHRETGATLQWQYYASPSQEVTDIETAAVSGSGADVVSYGLLGLLIQSGQFPYLSNHEWTLVGGRNSFVPGMLEYSGLSPKRDIGIPYESNPYVLAYNKNYFRRAGIKTPPRTWSEYVADAKKIQRAVPGVYGSGFDPADSFDPWKNLWMFDEQLGGRWVVGNGKPTLDTPQMRKAVQFYMSFYYKYHIVPRGALSWNSSDMASAFFQGKVAMVPLATYGYVAAATGTPLQREMGFAPLPDVPYGMTKVPAKGIAVQTPVSGDFWAIPKYAGALRPLAVEFAKLSVLPSMQVTQFKLNGWIPVNNKGIAAVDKLAPLAKPFVSAEEHAAMFPAVYPVWSYEETGIETAIGNIANNMLLHNNQYSASYAAQQLATAQQAAAAHAAPLKS